MASTYCPMLRREPGKRYVCTLLDKEINPIIMPCFGSHEECPIYRSQEEKGEVAEVAMPKVEEGLGEVRISFETPIPSEDVLTKKIEEFNELLGKFRDEIRRINKLRAEYTESLKRLRDYYDKLQGMVEAIKDLLAEAGAGIPEAVAEARSGEREAEEG